MDRFALKHTLIFRPWFFSGLVCLSALAQGQLTRPGNPLPLLYPGLKYPVVYEFQVGEQEKRKALEVSGGSMLKPAHSGMRIEVDYDPANSGTWDTLADRTRIWRCGFHVEGARLLSLMIKPFQIKSGVRIYLYDPLQQNILGAFSDLNNKGNQLLATGQVAGENLFVEIQVPPYADNLGNFTIAAIGCDFGRESGWLYKDGWFGLSGDCNVDINCLDDPAYQLVKNSVVRIVYMGGERCTGTLLNNTRRDGRNYLLTAEHCIHTEEDANAAVFYFSYESPYCGGPDGISTRSVSGATLRATGENLDFSLLELLEPVPLYYHPYYAGWDNSANPPSFSYSIHHPQGDVKKISIEDDPVTIASFGESYNNNNHWLVSHWETGTTEAGSSGSGLFDKDNRIRGSLTGGLANCINSVNDYFQMLSHDWQDLSLPENQLAYWLDPLDDNIIQLDGYDPYTGFWASGDTLSNFLAGEEMKRENEGLTWGSWSGHNSASISQFAEHFSTQQKDKVLGLILQVDRNEVISPLSHLLVKIWQDQEMPGNIIYQQEILLNDLSSGMANFVEFDSIVSVTDSFFAGYEIFYNNPSDTFSTFLADRKTDPLNTAFVYDIQWQSLDQFTGGFLHSSFGIMPLVFDSVPQSGPGNDLSDDLILYPNPADNFCWLQFREMLAATVQLCVYNMQGECVNELKFGPYQRNIKLVTANLSNGVYLVRVKRDHRLNTVKMVIVR
jgi:lysyl endopeptidase